MNSTRTANRASIRNTFHAMIRCNATCPSPGGVRLKKNLAARRNWSRLLGKLVYPVLWRHCCSDFSYFTSTLLARGHQHCAACIDAVRPIKLESGDKQSAQYIAVASTDTHWATFVRIRDVQYPTISNYMSTAYQSRPPPWNLWGRCLSCLFSIQQFPCSDAQHPTRCDVVDKKCQGPVLSSASRPLSLPKLRSSVVELTMPLGIKLQDSPDSDVSPQTSPLFCNLHTKSRGIQQCSSFSLH
jgi:hypothetical protein